MKTQTKKMDQAIRKIKRQFPDSEAVFMQAYNSMRQKANDRCACDVPILEWHVRIAGEFKYRCLRCRKVISPLAITPLGRQHKNLTETIDLACRFYFTKRILTPTEIIKIYGCQYRTAIRQTKRVVKWIHLAEQHSGSQPEPFKLINAKRICRSFSLRHKTVNAAVDSLFDSLPSLKEAMNNTQI